MKEIKKVISQIYSIVIKPEMKVLPGQLAFFLVLSIIPTVVLLGFICSTFKVPFTNVIYAMNEVLPKGVSDILVSYINGEGLNLSIGLSTAVGFVLASNGPHSIIITSNTLYGIPHSNYLKRRIKALILTILLLLSFVFTLIVLAFGNHIVAFLLSLKVFQPISALSYKVYFWLKWPLALFIIFFMVKLIYSIAPDSHIPSRFNTKGTIFTTLGWIFTTIIYSYYVSNIGNYNMFYGNLTNIIVLMLWIYFLSYILVFGMAINANSYKNYLDNKN